MWRVVSLLIAVWLLALGGTVSAAEKPAFSSVDVDGDGKISIQQATKAGISKAEAKAEDQNKDGSLTEGDWRYIVIEKDSA